MPHFALTTLLRPHEILRPSTTVRRLGEALVTVQHVVEPDELAQDVERGRGEEGREPAQGEPRRTRLAKLIEGDRLVASET